MTINISWEYFLGIVAFLIGMAWYSGSRFSAIETSIQWLKDTVNELKTSFDNASSTPAFGAHSPVNLTSVGEIWLTESGLKEYIDTYKEELMRDCEEKKGTNPYEVQKHVFKNFDVLTLKPEFDNKLKKFAYEKRTTMNVLRRVGAIYFRNLCLESFGMHEEDIDKHDPEKIKK